MKILIFILLIIFSSTIFAKNSGVMLKIFQKETNLNESTQHIIRLGVSEILTSNQYFLIDEQSQEEALKEQSEQREKGCFDESCLVDTGKMLAANKILMVELSPIGQNILFAIKFIDVETGSIIKTSSTIFKGDISDSESLLNFSKEVSIAIFNSNKSNNSTQINKTPKEQKIESNKKVENIESNKKDDDWDSEFYFDWLKLSLSSDLAYFSNGAYDYYDDYEYTAEIFAAMVGLGLEFFIIEGDWYKISLFSINISLGASNESAITLVSGSVLKTLIISGKFSFGISIGPLLGDAFFLNSNGFETASGFTTEIGYNLNKHLKLKLNLAPPVFEQDQMYKLGIVYNF
ncbi:hypothetical protein JXR93_12010 [bacterium]|nr:hypothetical protein [bacterium]